MFSKIIKCGCCVAVMAMFEGNAMSESSAKAKWSWHMEESAFCNFSSDLYNRPGMSEKEWKDWFAIISRRASFLLNQSPRNLAESYPVIRYISDYRFIPFVTYCAQVQEDKEARAHVLSILELFPLIIEQSQSEILSRFNPYEVEELVKAGDLVNTENLIRRINSFLASRQDDLPLVCADDVGLFHSVAEALEPHFDC
ncbi:MAG: hypothetical protein LBJ89_01940 [Holosporales bacterium]|nr:hypothetical protein [Holosporales bacterium]